jgi:hypothetical protein
MSWLLRRKFLALLIALALLIVGYPFSRGFLESRLLFAAFLSLPFLAAFLVIFTHKWSRLPGVVLGLPLLALNAVGYALPGELPPTAVLWWHVLAGLFIGFTTAAVLRSLAAERRVTADHVFGAFCGYLLLAVLFGHLYCLLEILRPGSFGGDAGLTGRLASATERLFLLTLVSLGGLTTLGSGDLRAVSDAARGLVGLEAVLGQFYLGAFIADLVGKKIAQELAPPQNSR